MFIHPSIHLEIARQRQQDLMARSERHRTAGAAPADRHEDRSGALTEFAPLQEPLRTTTACRPERVNA
jgi:hypothetical protein